MFTNLPKNSESIRNKIEKILSTGKTTLSEYDSKLLLSAYNIPVVEEKLISTLSEAVSAAREFGFPVVAKGCSSDITHKTESGMLELNIYSELLLEEAFNRIKTKAAAPLDGILIQKMIHGDRELVAGLVRDETFGPCVMFGLGGIYTEVLKDVSFRVAPLEKNDALEMLEEIKGNKILGNYRNKKHVNKETLSQILIAVGKIGLDFPAIREIDINPLMIYDGEPVAVDALVILK